MVELGVGIGGRNRFMHEIRVRFKHRPIKIGCVL